MSALVPSGTRSRVRAQKESSKMLFKIRVRSTSTANASFFQENRHAAEHKLFLDAIITLTHRKSRALVGHGLFCFPLPTQSVKRKVRDRCNRTIYTQPALAGLF